GLQSMADRKSAARRRRPLLLDVDVAAVGPGRGAASDRDLRGAQIRDRLYDYLRAQPGGASQRSYEDLPSLGRTRPRALLPFRHQSGRARVQESQPFRLRARARLPFYNILHMTNWVTNGLAERFPKLPVIWIEG